MYRWIFFSIFVTLLPISEIPKYSVIPVKTVNHFFLSLPLTVALTIQHSPVFTSTLHEHEPPTSTAHHPPYLSLTTLQPSTPTTPPPYKSATPPTHCPPSTRNSLSCSTRDQQSVHTQRHTPTARRTTRPQTHLAPLRCRRPP